MGVVSRVGRGAPYCDPHVLSPHLSRKVLTLCGAGGNTEGRHVERSAAVLVKQDVGEALERVHFPATKVELVNYAVAQFAPEEVIHALDELPEEKYESLEAVRQTLRRVYH